MTNYTLREISWDELSNMTKKIYDEIVKKKIEIDTFVPILRGGMSLGLLLGKYMQDVNTSCVHIRRSKNNKPNSEFGEAQFMGITNSEAITNKNILIIEDIIDSGLSLDLALQKIKYYKPKSIHIATFFNFNKDKYASVISSEVPASYVWVMFPWDGE